MDSYYLQIERALLSSIFFDSTIFDDILGEIKAEEFSYVPHQHIFRAVEELHRLEEPIEESFARKKLSKIKNFNFDELIEILAVNPVVNIKEYIKEIKDSAIKRDLNAIALNIKDLTSKDDIESNFIIDTIQSEIYKVTQGNLNSDFITGKEASLRTLEHIKKMKERGNSLLTGLDTGFYELNKMTTGFGDGDLIIVAARPAMGKTAFVLNVAQKVLEKNEGVAFFSLEMPAEQLILRMLSAKTSVALQNLRVGNLVDEEWERVGSATEWLSDSSLFIDDNSALNIHQLRGKLRKLKTKHKEVKLAIIDYLQLMSGSGSQDRHLEVSEISRGLKVLARELNMPIIALSQLNRGLESRSDKRPMLSDLRESGSIEQDADIILFVYRDAVYRLKEEKDKEEQARRDNKEYKSSFEMKNEEETEIIIGKQRNGPIGTVKLMFHKHCTRFVGFDKETVIEYQTLSSKSDIKETKMDIPII